MTTSVKESESEVALFIHQMIPHHQNAVNMAKGKLFSSLCFLITSTTLRTNNSSNFSYPYVGYNTIKALLKTGKLKCDDLTDEESEQADDCALEIILREIVNNQNAQIQAMRAILESNSYPQENDCKVPMGSDGSNVALSDEVTTSSVVTSGTMTIAMTSASIITLLHAASMMLDH